MLAQVIVPPTQSPTLNDGGWVYNAAILLAVVGALIALAIVFGYMRFAPRFQIAEEGRRSVRAPRIQPGKEVRRPVNVVGTPVVVQPPSVAPDLAAPAASSAAPSAHPAPAVVATPPPPAAAPAEEPATAPADVPAAAPEQSPGATKPAATAAGERKEVPLDQETFDEVLAELVEKGTERRVAEGQARRAAMIAARKKAEG